MAKKRHKIFFCAVSKVLDRVKTVALWSAKKKNNNKKDHKGLRFRSYACIYWSTSTLWKYWKPCLLEGKYFLITIHICMYHFWFMVFNTTFNNISVIWWQSVLLMEETGIPGDNNQPVASHWQTLSHNVSSTPHRVGFELTTLVVIGTNDIGSCKSNYHSIMTTMGPVCIVMQF